MPTIAPLHQNGTPQPYMTDNTLVVSRALDTGTDTVTSWYVDMADTAAGPVRFDEFTL